MSNVVKHNAIAGRPVLKIVLAVLVGLGIIDDATVVGILDNIIVIGLILGQLVTVIKEVRRGAITKESAVSQGFLLVANLYIILNDFFTFGTGAVDNWIAWILNFFLFMTAVKEKKQLEQ
jgi:hypothetical protein